MIKVAMLSKWHVHAGGYANQLKNSGKVEITCVWDDDTARGEAWAKELGCDFVADLDALLARDDVEAVVCDTPTTLTTMFSSRLPKPASTSSPKKLSAPPWRNVWM